MMDVAEFVANVPSLSDLELAVLLSLMAKQHCLVYTDDDLVDSLASELALIAADVFGLSCAIVDAADLQSSARFDAAILGGTEVKVDDDDDDDDDNDNDNTADVHARIANISFAAAAGQRRGSPDAAESRSVANVVIAKDFNLAADAVQFRVLELIRRRRVFGTAAVHHAPATFLFLPLVSAATRDAARLNHHLNDRIFMAHYHRREHGFPLLDEMADGRAGSGGPLITSETVDCLRGAGQAAAVTPEVRRHLQDLVVFLRAERDVDGGVSAHASVCLLDLARYLAPLHGIDYVTPALVGLAAHKVYLHRLVVAPAAASDDVDLQLLLAGQQARDPEAVVDAVLDKLDCPV